MDFLTVRDRATVFLKRYKYVALILLLGILLMMVPEKKEHTAPAVPTPEDTAEGLQEQLAHILSKIQGTGKVEVLLTEYEGSETCYQTNRNRDSDSLREDTVVVSDSQRTETGLVRQINPPRYLGAIVICQGGGDPAVKLAVLEAVMKATGLKSNQISVLKMK